MIKSVFPIKPCCTANLTLNCVVVGITDANFATILNTIKTTVAYIPYVPEDLEETITVEFLGYIQELALNDTATLAKYALR